MTIPISFTELPERLQVWRPTSIPDDYGGSKDELIQRPGRVAAKVSQPAAAEQIEAMQAGSSLTMIVHLRPDADVRRGYVLVRPDGDRLRVKYTLHPSERVYLRADCEQIQGEGDRE
jgi:hypothetical protein